jgi:cell division inhibitor SepF
MELFDGIRRNFKDMIFGENENLDDEYTLNDKAEPTEQLERPSKSDKSSSTGRKVIPMSVATNPKVCWHRPRSYTDNGEAKEISDDLISNRFILLNLENINKNDARRLLDFLGGVSYARNGVVKKVAINTYYFGPYNVDFVGDEFLTAFEDNFG